MYKILHLSAILLLISILFTACSDTAQNAGRDAGKNAGVIEDLEARIKARIDASVKSALGAGAVQPIWSTLWFWGIVAVLILAGSTLGGHQLRVRRLQKRGLELEQRIEQEIAQRMQIEKALRQSETERAVAAERSRLARELHDAVTQTLFSASLLAEALPSIWERNPMAGRENLVRLRQMSRGALA